MKFNEIKPGNYLKYYGRVDGFYNRQCEVISIDPTKEGKDSFEVSIEDWKQKSTSVRAYEGELWPITLEPSHLEKLGFKKDQNVNVFRRDGLIVFRPIFVRYLVDRVEYIDKGFVVVNQPMELPLTEDVVEKSTTSLTSIHTFQNYLASIDSRDFDWKTIL